MATSETQFQTELIKDMTAHGMHAFKASHREKTGVADLWVRDPSIGLWVECKFMKVDKSFQTQKVSMTRPQWSFLKRELQAGGEAAKIIGYVRKTEGHDRHGLLICDPTRQDTQVMRAWLDDDKHVSHVIKHRGSAWPVGVIVDRIVQMRGGLLPWAHQERGE